MQLIEELKKIRKLTIIALFSDDELMNIFVLKGGNALDIAHNINSRASTDIDLSMESDFTGDELEAVRSKLEKLLVTTFKENGYHAFDITLQPRPFKKYSEKDNFWGGYRLEFKVINNDKYNILKGDLQAIRVNSLAVGEGQKRNFKVDISKYEFCKGKQETELDDFTIYVYSPLMVVYEKLRAICQQMEEYQEIIRTNRKGRAKDFFDIYTIIEQRKFPVELDKPENLEMLKEIFLVKKVPLSLIRKMQQQREFHRDSFAAVKDAVYEGPNYKLESYDYYFDYVVEKVKLLESLWEK
jgi:predicted nucleotidyltransferase component of viral defense system